MSCSICLSTIRVILQLAEQWKAVKCYVMNIRYGKEKQEVKQARKKEGVEEKRN